MLLGIYNPKASSLLYPAVQAIKRLLETAGRTARRGVPDGSEQQTLAAGMPQGRHRSRTSLPHSSWLYESKQPEAGCFSPGGTARNQGSAQHPHKAGEEKAKREEGTETLHFPHRLQSSELSGNDGPQIREVREVPGSHGQPLPDPHARLPRLWTRPRAPAEGTSEGRSSGFPSRTHLYGSDAGTSGSPGDPGAASKHTHCRGSGSPSTQPQSKARID